MARAKTPRTNNSTSNQVITMPEAGSTPSVRKAVSLNAPTPIDLEEQIRRRAYELYEERGRTPGMENEDWLQAEREVRARSTRQHRA